MGPDSRPWGKSEANPYTAAVQPIPEPTGFHAGRALLVIAALGFMLAACTPRSTIRPQGSSDDTLHAIEHPGPFAPVSLRIHPLTHIETGPTGEPTIICHVEFKDRWHQAVKAAGPLEIQLYRPAGGLQADMDRQDVRWPLPLDDLERNADWYDTVTRTYRFQLDLPPGLVPSGSGSKDVVVRLHAVFAARTAEGGEVTLHDDYMMRP